MSIVSIAQPLILSIMQCYILETMQGMNNKYNYGLQNIYVQHVVDKLISQTCRQPGTCYV